MLKGGDGLLEVVPVAVAVSTTCARSVSGAEAYLFGLELLVYSYSPTGLPTDVWAKVVEREI